MNKYEGAAGKKKAEKGSLPVSRSKAPARRGRVRVFDIHKETISFKEILKNFQAYDFSLRLMNARRAFDSSEELYSKLGVPTAQGRISEKQVTFDQAQANQIKGLDITVSLLQDFLEESSIPKWLHGFNAHLGNRRPVDVLLQGRLSEVIRAIEAEKAGAYA
jgi:hypothetical protein